MQITNIPAPDDNSREIEDNFNDHSDYPDIGETGSENQDIENPNIPVPPGSKPAVPVEEPPSSIERSPVDEDGDTRTRLV